MSRSVNVPSNSAAVLYFSYDDDEDFFYDTISSLCAVIGSVDNRFDAAGDNEWIGREGRVISKCSIASIVLSEYCGLCSLAIVPKEDADDDAWEPLKECWEAFATEWSEDFFTKLRAKLVEDGFGLLKRLGTFSNGEGVFERASS